MEKRPMPDRLGKRALLLQALRRSPGASRARLAQDLGWSTGTVRILTEELTRMGLLREIGTNTSTGGRPSARLAVNGEAGKVIGVDLGELDMRLGLYDWAGTLVEHRRVSFRQGERAADPEHVVSQIIAFALPHRADLLGIGLAVPGQLDLEAGTVVYSANLAWSDVALREPIEEAAGVPVIIERNSVAGMVAELAWGRNRPHGVGVYITMGSGVGASISSGGQVFRGEQGFAGELGHVVVDPHGPSCTCGRAGCLETFASISAIQDRFDDMRGVDEPGDDLLAALAQGDEMAREAVREAGHYLGSALVSLVNLLNPGLIILSGQLMAGTLDLVEALSHTVRSRALPHSARALEVVASGLGQEGMLRGAATLVLDSHRGRTPQDRLRSA